MDLFASFTTDPKAEVEGRWFPYAGGQVLLARNFNKNHSKDFLAKLEAHKTTLDLKNDEADALAERLQAESLAAHVLLDWKGFTQPEGGVKGAPQVPLPYSKEVAARALMLRDFRRGVLALADDFNKFLVQEEETDAKNSLTA